MLSGLGARLRGAQDDVSFLLDAATLEAGGHVTFATDLGDVDVFGTPAGTVGYADLAPTATPLSLGDLTVRVAAIDDLIRMKRAAGRPKDHIEIEVLVAVREERDARGAEGRDPDQAG